MELVKSPIENTLQALLKKATKEILIASPYINIEGVKSIKNEVQSKGELKISVLTNLSVQNVTSNVTQPKAILKLCEGFKEASVSSLHRLHAKIYLIDGQISLITSANLTQGGLKDNYEYGVVIEDEAMVQQIKNDLVGYRRLANQISLELLKEIAEENEGIQNLKSEHLKAVENDKLTKALKKAEQQLNDKLLFSRVQHGQSINAIFSETILYLLEKHESLTTRELNKLIQEIHPDICDDKIDRIINGQRFGKLWKHAVRNAQRHLKELGKIDNLGQGRKTVWFLKQ
ncbi:MAG: phospholipase D family protein [Chloroherpetonaceae bacterium]